MLIFRDKLFADLGIGKKVLGGLKKAVKPSEYSKVINNGLPKRVKANHTPIAKMPRVGSRPSKELLAKVKGPSEISPTDAMKRISERGSRAIEPPKPVINKGADPLNRLSSTRESADRLKVLRERFKAEKAMKNKPGSPL